MKKLYILTLLIVYAMSISAQIQTVIDWQKCYGGSSNDAAHDVISTNDGGYIVVGATESNDGDITGSYGGYDFCLIKLDHLGNLQWQKSYGGSGYDVAHSIKNTSDGGYILGGTTGSNDGDVTGNHGNNDYWLVKLDSLGNIEWQKCYGGGSNDTGYIMQTTSDGGYIIAGESLSNNGNVSGNNGSYDYWIVKVDSIGNIQWQKSLGGMQSEVVYSITETNSGEFIITGKTDSYTGMVTCNHMFNQFNSSTDNWVVKLDSSGNMIWHRCLGGNLEDIGQSIIQSSDGNYVVAGWTKSNNGDVSGNHGNDDLWVVKFDTSSNIIWQKCYGGSSSDKAHVIKESVNGGYLIGGYTDSKNGDLINFNYWNCWIIKVDSAGTIEWQKSFGGNFNPDKIFGIHENSNGEIVVVGTTNSNDGDVSGNHGQTDFWVVKLTTSYNIISGNAFLDLNGNSVRDTGEAYLINHLVSEGSTGRNTFTNNTGYYNLNVLNIGTYSISTNLLPYYIPAPSVHNISFSTLNQIDSINDFSFIPTGSYNDLKITVTPIGAFRPGFNAYYNLNYKNIGTTSTAGSVIFYLDSNLTFVTSLPVPTLITPDSIVWSTGFLNPYEEGSILLTVNVDPASVIGTIINSKAIIEPLATDADITNNTAFWDVTVTGSFDPNDILVSRETIFTNELLNPPFLEYLIRFQNTGNDTAFTVKILNNLTEKLNLSSFELVNSSHPVQLNYYRHSRLLEFIFENILLPDSNTNETLSHGFIRYRTKPVISLNVGDSIENTASIYFDFNAPVITNTAVTEIVLSSSVAYLKDNFNFSLYPNPAKDEINVSFILEKKSTIKMQLYNNLGQVLHEYSDNKTSSGINKINLSTEKLKQGIYFLKFTVEGETITRKLVKM